MHELLQLLARRVEQVHHLADSAGEQITFAFRIGEAGDLLHPFHAEAGDVGDRAVRGDSTEPAVVASGDEAGGTGICGQDKHGAVMCGHRMPGGGIRQPRDLHRAVAQSEGDRGIVAGEPHGNHEGAEVAGDAAVFQQELGGHGLAHAGPFGSV